MTQKQATRKSTKVVQIIARYFIKRNGHVVYTVRSSNGQDTYTTTLVNGKATGCSCLATKPCYHMVQLEAKEQERKEQEAIVGDKSFAQVMDAQYAGDPRTELAAKQNPSTVATNMVVEAKRRQSAPLHRTGFNLLRS